MVGAIIGDLAAWTWEHDKNAFYKKLIMAEAVPSPFCEDMLLTANLLMGQKDMDYETYSRYFKSTNQIATILRAVAIGWLIPTCCNKNIYAKVHYIRKYLGIFHI